MKYLITLIFLLAAAGCDNREKRTAERVEDITCAWSSKYKICLCNLTVNGGHGYGLTIAPPEVCGHIVMPPECISGKAEEESL